VRAGEIPHAESETIPAKRLDGGTLGRWVIGVINLGDQRRERRNLVDSDRGEENQ